VEHELDEELREFLDNSVAGKLRAGMSRQQAYRTAKMELGGIEAVKEKVRAATWESWIEALWSDVLCVSIQFLRSRQFLSLSLGISANTAIFQRLRVATPT
jgi:hypothetical protein